MYRLVFFKEAVSELKRVDQIWQKRIKHKLSILCRNPEAMSQNIKPLKGKFKSLFRLRVGSYRIIYTIRENEMVILVIRIAQRGNAYR